MENRHPRQTEAVAERHHVVGDLAQVLGDEGQSAQRLWRRRRRRGGRVLGPSGRWSRHRPTPAPPSRRRIPGSGRDERGRRWRGCGAAGRSTRRSRPRPSGASHRAGFPRAGRWGRSSPVARPRPPSGRRLSSIRKSSGWAQTSAESWATKIGTSPRMPIPTSAACSLSGCPLPVKEELGKDLELDLRLVVGAPRGQRLRVVPWPGPVATRTRVRRRGRS